MCKGARPNWGCTPGRGEGNVCVRGHVPSGGVHQAAGMARCVQGHVPTGGVHRAAGGQGVYRGTSQLGVYTRPRGGRGV